MKIETTKGEDSGCWASFEAALRISDTVTPRPPMRVGVFIWSFVILLSVSLLMLCVGDKLNASGMVMTRFMASTQAPLTAQYAYSDKARDQITVVMYDQQFLEDTHSAWPISYQDHADWLLRLAGDPAARPKAILLDITFGQGRNDPTLPALKKALCTVQNEFKVPIFLAALPAASDGRLTVRAGLADDQPAGAPNCFTLVGVDYLPDPLDGLAWSYQLSRHRSAAGWQSGPASDPEVQPSYRSAAMAIAQDAANLDLGRESVPMSLIWGHNSAPQPDRPNRLAACRPGEFGWQNFIPGVVRQFFEDPAKPPLCPYHRTLSMAQLGELSEKELAPYLAHRYVMVGANIPGYNDFVDSPVHRLLPGVYLHAMALDNFLTYGSDYKLSAEWTDGPLAALLVPCGLVVLVVLVVHLVWSAVIRWLAPQLSSPAWYDNVLEKNTKQRTLKCLVTAVVWLARILVQTIVAMWLIAKLQDYFRIGMLPVVELVSMTLLAEGLNYLSKLRWYFLGKEQPDKQTQPQTEPLTP
ncbi:CHASE2 domain-containing protein [Noviherbaspirillum malthae]|uniref:CHASE2 domain-containing protein n=1 Tax=Noviherbaspirillum malthae TaxID=1260987 RepID=UPI00188FE4D4|nr:CHASE2 domain-containing protein [Noviherbaspirillum malthae]